MMAILIGIITLSLEACNSNNHNGQEEKVSQNVTDTSITTAPEQTVDTALMYLKAFKGQYPTEANFLDLPELRQRLSDLLGSRYADFRRYWQTETPIEVEDNVLSTTGCEQHNCAANQYILQIDLKHNNINVYHLGQDIQSYLEKGKITLPPNMERDMQTILQNNP